MKHYTTISVAEAHHVSKVGYKPFFDSIIKGYLEVKGPKELDENDYPDFKSHPEEYFIPLKELPPFAIRDYLIEKETEKGQYLGVDLAAYKKWSQDTHNPEAIPSLLYQIQAILAIQNREKDVFTQNPEQLLLTYLQKYGLKKDRYNRLRTLFNENGLDILLNLHPGTKRKSICPYAENYIIEDMLDHIAYSLYILLLCSR